MSTSVACRCSWSQEAAEADTTLHNLHSDQTLYTTSHTRTRNWQNIMTTDLTALRAHHCHRRHYDNDDDCYARTHACMHSCTHISQWPLLLLHPFHSSMDFVRDYLGELVAEPIWILLKQECQWHQLGHMQICISSAPCQHPTTQWPFKPTNYPVLKLNREDTMDRNRRRNQIRDDRWPQYVWVGECFFWYQLIQVVPVKSREP